MDENQWTLTAPDGRQWQGETKIKCFSAETNERVPASVQLDRIMSEVEETRQEEERDKDAARYRWLREQDWFDGALCVLRDPKRVLTKGVGLGADCPSRDRLDAAIDAELAALSRSEQTK